MQHDEMYLGKAAAPDQFAGMMVLVGALPFQRATRVMATAVEATAV